MRYSNRSRLSEIAVLLAGALLVGACGASPTPAAPENDSGLVAGRDVYIRNCASCHGSAGGGGRGPRMDEGRTTDTFPSVEDQILFVAEGKRGMPGFSDRLSAEEIEDVVRFVREVL